MKILIVLSIFTISGCATLSRYNSNYLTDDYSHRHYYLTNYGHQIREQRLKIELERQYEELEEIRLRDQIRYNQIQIEKARIRQEMESR